MLVTDITAAHLAAETERVVATAGSFRNDAVLAPSLCPGWSRGHVLSHLARNAEALGRVCAAVLSGSGQTMYDSDEARDAEIEAGARRHAADLAEDVRVTAQALAPELARIGPEHVGRTAERTPGGRRVPVELVPFMRLRELVFHHVDLDAGFTFGQVDPALAALFLDRTVDTLRRTPDAPGLELRTDEGDVHLIGDGATSVTGTRAGMLLWLTREQPDEVHCETTLPTLPKGL